MADRPGSTVVLVAALIGAVGLAVGGALAGRGFVAFRTGDRYVSVKGVAEREVQADLALWPLRITETDDDLRQAQAKIGRSTRAIYAFLGRHGVDTTQIELQGVEVTDARANAFREGPITSRYSVTQTLMVRSTTPDVISAASQRVGELIEAGVVLSSGRGYGPARPTYLFTKLNDVKPAMIAEATASAREAAERFAADSKSRVGGIRQANQGVFVILPRDQAPGISEEEQPVKTVRVVATVEYFLR